ncbi:hypothetical protein EDD86DRAFT_272937 [Gorgonomyces haynaldii]|nr:hypothetical protein EDD86DRAFT_272937 [Gorgonomyces haynaldii]
MSTEERQKPRTLKPTAMARVGSTSRSNLPAQTQRYTYQTVDDQVYQQGITVDDDLSFTTTGRQETMLGLILYHSLCLLTGGIYYLACRWHTNLEIETKTVQCALKEAKLLVITNQWDEITLVRIQKQPFGGKISSIFPRHFNDSDHVDRDLDEIVFYEYRYFRFILNPLTGQFEPNYAWCDPKWNSVPSLLDGSLALSRDDVEMRNHVFGTNAIDIQEKTTLKLLFDEILHPFFVFQIASIVLWSIDNYYYYAACIFIITVLSTVATLVETKTNVRRMKNLAKFSCQVRLWRNGSWSYWKSEDMVPGDIFEIESGQLPILPCDAVLLEGDCIVNESMLTGESLPVSKNPISDKDLELLDFEDEEPASSPRMASYFLFAGTKIIRVRKAHTAQSPGQYTPSNSKRGAIALVVRTGFNTSKGSLIRSMLFPRPNQFKFYRDSFRFIGVLAFISFLGFLFSLYYFIRLKVDWVTIMFRALDLITIAVPPALPATMAIGTSFAIRRLRKSDIFCTSPPRVNICGKLNIMCFDKTGTLTEEGLDVLGIRFTVPMESIQDSPMDQTNSRMPLRFSRLYRNIDAVLPKPLVIPQRLPSFADQSPKTPLVSVMSGTSVYLANDPRNPTSEDEFPYPLIVCAMATCHSIKVVQGEHMGDPLDLKMFDFTGWHLEEDVATPIQARRNTSTHRQMVVRPPWVPDFEAVTSGYYGTDEELFTEIEVLRSFEFVSSLRRMSVVCRRHRYSNGQFMEQSHYNKEWDIFVKGAPEVMKDICLQAYLPPDYDEQLKYYTHHGYRVLAVGWKHMNGISPIGLAKLRREDVECQLQFLGFVVFENKLKPGTIPVVRTLNKANIRQVMCTGDNLLTAISVSRECGLVNPESRIYIPKFVSGQANEEDAVIEWEDVDDESKKLNSTTLMPPLRTSRRDISVEDYELAITGDVFEWMLDFADDDLFEKMLVKCQIYSRMSPDLKHFLVENLQGIGYTVGFCGDGTNDCGALKSADAGLSLSEAEASVAAPFTSKQMDLDCVLRVIREGRAAMVTSFCCFKYMALYSLIQFTTVSLLYTRAQNISDFQFMYIDLALIIPVAVFMGQTKSHPQIHSKRPTASLVSKKVLSSMIGQFMIQFLFQVFVFVWVLRQPWYKPGIIDLDAEIYLSMENTVVFLTSSYQYLITAIVFTVGPPYQESIWKNVPYITLIIGLSALTSWITLAPPPQLMDILKLVELPSSARTFVFALAVLNFGVSWTAERYIFPQIAKWIGTISERMLLKEPRTIDEANLPPMRLAKIRKWQQNGKRFKIIQDQFK